MTAEQIRSYQIDSTDAGAPPVAFHGIAVMNAEEMRRRVSDAVGKAGGVRKFCELHGNMDDSAVYVALRGKRISARLVGLVGCERQIVYVVKDV